MPHAFNPDWVVAPGETLAETLAEWSLSIRSAARILGLAEADLEAILAGYERITPNIAQRLQMAFGISADVWLALERNYREGLKAGKKDKTHEDRELPPPPDRGDDHPAGRGDGEFSTDHNFRTDY